MFGLSLWSSDGGKIMMFEPKYADRPIDCQMCGSDKSYLEKYDHVEKWLCSFCGKLVQEAERNGNFSITHHLNYIANELLHQMPARINIKDLSISRWQSGRLWLNRADGEGMGVNEDQFYEVLDKFFEENF